MSLLQSFRNSLLTVRYKKQNQFVVRHSMIEKNLEGLNERKTDLHNLDQCPNITGKTTKEEGLLFFERMNLIRKMENNFTQMYQHGIVRGFCHVYTGQEACAVGIKSVMREQDTAVSAYRCHAWALLMSGCDEKALIAIVKELAGKKTGLNAGKSGSMHLYTDKFYGGHGIIGANVSVGTGLAFAHKYKNDGGICFTMIGDGAVNNGQTSESFNFAKISNLPIIYVIENNGYGMGTSINRVSMNHDLYKRGDLIPGIRVSGMDVLTVRDTMKFAIKYVLEGKGPIIVELLTYRYSGHSVADPGTSYRTREEIKRVRDNYDPITTFSGKLLAENIVKEEELKAIEKKNDEIVKRAVEAALKDDDPPLSDLVKNVYVEYGEKIRTIETSLDSLKK